MITSRTTKYVAAVTDSINKMGHATNAELIDELRQKFPDVSATTVHRVSSRLVENGEIGVAPADFDGSMRFDKTTIAHDHFICSGCGGIRDIDVVDKLLPVIQEALGGCKVSGRLVIKGECEKCKVKIKGA